MKLRLSQIAALPALSVLLFCILCSVQVSQAQNIINTFVGGGQAGGSALNIDLPGPTAAIRDAAGNIYFAAPYSTYVFKLTGNTVTTFSGTGVEGFGGDGGPAASAILALPSGLTVDSKGNIYIADFGTARIRMIDSTGNITTVAGNGVKCEPSTGTCGDGGPALKASFNFPLGVAVDGVGNIYVADAFDHRIRRIDAVTRVITTFAGNGIPCPQATGGCGDGGTPLASTLNYPQSVAFDSAGNLYIADTRNNRIRLIPPGGATISTVAGTGATCNPTALCGDGGLATAAHLYMPMSIFVDPSNNLYIADTYDHKIRFVNGQTQIISTVAGTGVQGFAGDGGTATSAQLNYPQSVFLDASGNLLVADKGNQRVRQISGGTISTLAGGGLGNDGGSPLNAILANPFNVTEDAAGNLYIADTANNRIRFVNVKTSTISTIAGTGIAGYAGDSGPALNATLNGPTGVAIDGAGNLFIADTSNLVIRKVDATTQQITTYAGTGKSCPLGTTNACGDGGAATSATFSTPLAITLDSAANLYVADYTVHKIREVNGATQIISTIAGVGVSGAGGNGSPAVQAHLNHPSSVAVDSAGNVYIDDSYNNVVRRINASTGIINAWALSGGFTLTGDGGPALGGAMWAPMELALDPAGDLFIGGGNDNVVQRVDAATYTIGTVAGNYALKGVGGFSGDGGPATSAKISNLGLSVDGQGNLYIADAGNNRIRSVHLSPAVTFTAPSAFASYPIGTTSPAKSLSVINTGGADLSISDVSLGGNDPQDFSATVGCGPFPALLGVDMACGVNVTFTPVNYGKRTATVVVTDTASNSPQAVTLTGFGPYFTVAESPTSLKITRGTAKTTTASVAPFGQFNQAVNLSCTCLPANTTCSFATNPVTPDGTNTATSVLTVQTSSTTPTGTYVVNLIGAFGPQSQLQWSSKLQLIIN